MTSNPARFDVEELLAKLAIKDKIRLLTGRGWWSTEPVPELGIPPIRMSDGPNGLRGTQFFNGVPSSCFPSSTGLASSFDLSLASKVGSALSDEARAKSVHVLLAPTVNTQRSPLGGRGFESFSEDPQLNGKIAAAYINGLQSKGVAATIKHFAANDQEFQRFSISSDVTERALREIYLKPFQIAIKESNPWALMTSYNRVNGLHASEHPWLLQDILRKEWGYKGTLISDWTGTYSTVEAIKAGLDIEMPGPSVVRGQALVRALQAEKLFVEDIDIRVRKVLDLVKHAVESGIPYDGPEETLDTPEVRALLRLASASSIVLLKNNSSLLPLSLQKFPKIAVIGPNAQYGIVSGGGSAALRPSYVISPLEGIKNVVKELGGDPSQVKFTVGALTHRYLPLADPLITQPGKNVQGGLFEFWNESPTPSFLDPKQADLSVNLPGAAWSTESSSSGAFMADGVDEEKVNEVCWIRYTTILTPNETGTWEFGLNVSGRGNLYIDRELAVDLSTTAPQGDSFFGLGTIERRCLKELKAGQSYKIEIRLCNAEFIARGAPFVCRGGIRLGVSRRIDEDQGIKDAVELAKESDVVILIVGLNGDIESEGFDRDDMKLPGSTNRLVSEVLKANQNVVVVNQSGAPVEMPWVEEASTLLQAFYGGNEVGHGMADVIFGKVDPSAKLPLTFPKRLEDNPSYPSFGKKYQEYGKTLYNEGIFVGYRGYEIKQIKPLFPFGYGLTYTTFEYADLQVPSETVEDGSFTVTFTIKNTGPRAGSEIVQIYITDQEASLPRPVKELKGFTKVPLGPGEAKTVSVSLDVSALSFWDEKKGGWVAEAGVFDVLVAASSEDVKLKGTIELTKTVTYTGL